MYQVLTILFLSFFLWSSPTETFAQSSDSVLGDDSKSAVTSERKSGLSSGVNTEIHPITVYVFLLESCVISQYYTLVLNDLYEKYKDEGIKFVGYFPNNASSSAKIDSFADKYHIHFPLHLDKTYAEVSRFNATITPQVFVYNAKLDQIMYEGRIDDRFVRVGKRRPKARTHDLENALSAIINSETIEVTETTAVGCIINMNN